MRATQIFEFIRADNMPNLEESQHYYTHMDAISGQARAKLRKLRREYRKSANVYREAEQGDLVQLPNAGRQDAV